MTLKEIADINERRSHVILRGVEEGQFSEPEERKEAEREAILSVAETAGLDRREFEVSLRTHFRLGKRERDDGSRNKFRPIMIKMNSTYMRDKFLAAARVLRGENVRNGTKLRIEPDLSPAQIENLNDQWSKARELSLLEAKKGKRFYVAGKEDPKIRYRILSEEEKGTAEHDAREAIERAKRFKKRDRRGEEPAAPPAH